MGAGVQGPYPASGLRTHSINRFYNNNDNETLFQNH